MKKKNNFNFGKFKGKAEQKDYIENVSEIDEKNKVEMLSAGIDVTEKGRSGTYIQMDDSVVHSSSLYPGLEVMDIKQALKRYEWLDNYYWQLIKSDLDDFTKKSEELDGYGYFIRADKGVKAVYPTQACLFLDGDDVIQNVHNVVIAEENSDLNIITGCASSSKVKSGLHIGVTEVYVKQGATVTYTMIHNWSEDVVVRPRTNIIVEEGGSFQSNYICIRPVKDVQMYPKAKLIGRDATARFNSVMFAHNDSVLDIGAGVELKVSGAKAEIISRAVSAGGDVIARGYLKGEAKNIKAHLECKGLLLAEKGKIHAIPELEGNVSDVDMSHEAAIGRIAKEEIEYLMARGLREEDAQSAIIRGFMDTSIMGLPKELQKEIDKNINVNKKELF